MEVRNLLERDLVLVAFGDGTKIIFKRDKPLMRPQALRTSDGRWVRSRDMSYSTQCWFEELLFKARYARSDVQRVPQERLNELVAALRVAF